MRILALDVGERRIGIAISTPGGGMSIPLTTLDRRDMQSDLAALGQMVRDELVDRIVVGMPISMSGERGDQAERTEAFVDVLRESVTVNVDVWDERLSSVEAERRLSDNASSRRRRPPTAEERGRIDALAASIILQSYLDSQRLG